MRRAVERWLDSPRTVWVAAAISLALGLVFTLVWAPHPWGWKGIDSYHDLARSLARGEPFPTMKVPWGYSYFVAACYRLAGEREWVPPVVQVILNASIPLMLYRLVRPAVGQRPAAMAALLVGAFSFNTVYASTQSSDSVCTVLFVASLLCLVRGAQTGAIRYFALAGVLSGLVPQFRPNMLLFPPLAAVLYLIARRSRRTLAQVAVFIGLVTILQVPWVVRNYRLTGEFLPTSTHGGAQLWYGSLQVGPYLESRAHNPRSVFESGAFNYTSLLGRSIFITTDYTRCLDPERERLELVYWSDFDPQHRRVAPLDTADASARFEIPGYASPAVLYYYFEASVPGANPPVSLAVPPEGAANPFVSFVSADHLGDLDRHDDLLDLFDIVRLVQYLSWQQPLPRPDIVDLDRDGRITERDLSMALAILLPESARRGLPTPFDGLEVGDRAAVVRLAGGATVTMPRDFTGRMTDLEFRGELAGSLMGRSRSYTSLAALGVPRACGFADTVRINDVFFRGEPHAQRRYFALALDNIRREPVAFLASAAYRMIRLFIIRGTDDKATTQQFASGRLVYGAGLVLSAVYFLLFAAGVIVAWRRRSPLLVALVPIAYVPLTIGFVLTNMRYTITVQPLMFAFMALAIVAALGLDSPGGGERARG